MQYDLDTDNNDTKGISFKYGFTSNDLDTLFKNIDKQVENMAGHLFGRIRIDWNDRDIKIYGIDFDKLKERIICYYRDKKLTNLFIKNKTIIDEVLFNQKIIREKEANTSYLDAPAFYALELHKIFTTLGEHYGLSYYTMIANEIYKKTWLARDYSDVSYPIDLSPLKNIVYTLNGYQAEFVRDYNTLKYRSCLRGYILSFDQGLGKTLTAIALAECLGKKNIFIIVPNSLKENWANEIKQYYSRYTDEQLWLDEVYVVDHAKYRYTPHTRFVICNVESIEKIFPYLKSADSMLIIDEFHVNFRNINGIRTDAVLRIRNMLNTDDTLIMSGTPIKALPSEIAPALQLIDPLFDTRAAEIYVKAFAMDNDYAAEIVKERFNRFIYRRIKAEVLTLPKKHELTLNLHVKDYDKYLIANVNLLISAKFNSIYAEKLSTQSNLRERYVFLVNRYSNSSEREKRIYLDWVNNAVGTQCEKDQHELTMKFLEGYHNRYILPNIHSQVDKKDFLKLYSDLLKMRQSAIGLAIGQILPQLRTTLFIDLYKENKQQIIGMIKNNPRKTVIFSMMLPVVEYIYADLKASGVGIVKIVGGDGMNRMSLVNQFKTDDAIDCLIATSQTLATGVTITEADQMFFFGAPWRSGDKQQASDRIHRIGQTHEVYIYNVLLATQEPNLSTRMNDILMWSQQQFNVMIEKDIKTFQLENNDEESLMTIYALEHEDYSQEGILDSSKQLLSATLASAKDFGQITTALSSKFKSGLLNPIAATLLRDHLMAAENKVNSRPSIDLDGFTVYTPECVIGSIPQYAMALSAAMTQLKDVESRILKPLLNWTNMLLDDPSYSDRAWVLNGYMPIDLKGLNKQLSVHFNGAKGDGNTDTPFNKAYPEKDGLSMTSKILADLIKQSNTVLNSDLPDKATDIRKAIEEIHVRKLLSETQTAKMKYISDVVRHAGEELEMLAVIIFQIRSASYCHNETLIKIKEKL